MASSSLRFLDHTQRHITVGRTPLDEWSARRKDLYLATHTTHNTQTSMLPVWFEPTISPRERPHTCALDRTATGTGYTSNLGYKITVNLKKKYLFISIRSTYKGECGVETVIFLMRHICTYWCDKWLLSILAHTCNDTVLRSPDMFHHSRKGLWRRDCPPLRSSVRRILQDTCTGTGQVQYFHTFLRSDRVHESRNSWDLTAEQRKVINS